MSGSEDGQLQSPGNEDDDLMSTGDMDVDDEDEERDADSLDIKPPQAIVAHGRDRDRDRDPHGLGGRRGKEKLVVSGKDKKHSKERRHKERSGFKERERDIRSERRSDIERREYAGSGSGGGGGGSSGRHDEERYASSRNSGGGYERGNGPAGGGGGFEDSHDIRRGYGRHYDRGGEAAVRGNHYHHQQQQHFHQQYHHIQHMQQRQQHHPSYYERNTAYHHHGGSGGGGLDYHGSRHQQYSKHSGGGGSGPYSGNHHDDIAGEHRSRERDRRKYASNEQQAKDAESLEQDLRSRLLSKRHKYVRSSGGGETDDQFDDTAEFESSTKSRSRREKKREGGGNNVGDGSVIELLDDSPKIQAEYKHRRRHKNRVADLSPDAATETHVALGNSSSAEKRKTPDDPELLARRAKFLAAEREKKLRKESAREELQARREMLRERERNELSPSAVAASVTAGLNVIKRKIKDDNGNEHHRKRKRGSEKPSANAEGSDHDAESVGEDDDDDDSELEEAEEDDDGSASVSGDDSESHSDSGAAVSVKSASPPPPKERKKDEKRRSHRRLVVVDDSERKVLHRSANDDEEHADFNDDGASSGSSDHSYYEKSKSKRKSGKSSRIAAAAHNERSGDNGERSEEHSDMASGSESPIESEDSFYAKRKRDKRPKASDDESSADDSHEEAYYRADKASKSEGKPKRRAKGEHAKDNEDDGGNGSAVSEGSVKAQRVRKRRGNKLADEASDSRSEASDLESEDSYYAKKNRRRHQRRPRRHHHSPPTDDEDHELENALRHERKQERSKGGGRSATSGSERSDDIDFANGVHSNSGSDDGREQKRKKRKRSELADKFAVDINEDIALSMNEQGAAKSDRDSDVADGEEEVVVCDEKGVPLPNYFPGLQGCRTVEEFQCLNRIEEGTYGVVYRARDQRTNEIVALKRLKMEKEREGFPITSLREINTLLKGQHPNIVTVREIVVGSNMDKIFIVMDYVEHDLKSLMETMKTRKQVFFPGEVKCLTQQLLRAVGHLHDNWILHRDLKTSNLLLSHKGILKVGDFGLAREYGSPLRKYTSLVVTRWYRAPELLLCSPMYSTPIDIWSVGCIFAEFLLMTPYLPGKSDIDQLNRIFRELGTPNEKIWPGYNELPAVKNVLSQNTQFADYPMSNLRKRFADKVSDSGLSLLQGLLTYDPKQRLTAEAALDHAYFKEVPLPIDPSMFPTWPAKSEMSSARKAHSPKPPSGGAQFKQLGRDDIALSVSKTATTGGSGQSGGNAKVVSGIITGNKKTASNTGTGFVLNAGLDQRQLAMGPGFNLKF